MSDSGSALATATCDASGQLVSAQEPLAGLQQACGGTIPGVIAIPALGELVEKDRSSHTKLAMETRHSGDLAKLSAKQLEAMFDDAYHLKHVETIFVRVFGA